MPKVSKVNPPVRTRVNEDTGRFTCTRCGSVFSKQKYFFPMSHSQIYKANNGYMTVCGDCINEMFEEYKNKYGTEREAIRRMCVKFDIYWSEEVYGIVFRGNTSSSRIKSYISKTNLMKYVGKSYDDTLDEEAEAERTRADEENARIEAEKAAFVETEAARLVEEEKARREKKLYPEDADKEGGEPTVSREVMDFWGYGFDELAYNELEMRYKKWTEDLENLDSGSVSLYKQVCILEMTISRNAAAGKNIEQSVNALNTILGSLNQKPIQKKQDEAADAAFESMPFGVGIKMCENTRPIPEPDPEFQDVDGIVRSITVWFLGHLCKMLNIRNTYCKLYEDEISRLRVEREIPEDEDDEGAFNDIFGGTADGGGSS